MMRVDRGGAASPFAHVGRRRGPRLAALGSGDGGPHGGAARHGCGGWAVSLGAGGAERCGLFAQVLPHLRQHSCVRARRGPERSSW